MADLKEAVGQVQRFAPFMQAVLDIAAAVDGLGNLDKVAGEKQILINGLAGDLEKLQASVAEAQDKAAQIVADAHTEAEAIKVSAKDGAGKLVDMAANKLAAAEGKAAVMLQTAQDTLDTAQARMADIDAAVAAKTQELADLNAKIDRARAKMAEILGA